MNPVEQPIQTYSAIRGTGEWTRERIAHNLYLAEALDRPVGLETLRAIAFVLIQDDWRALHTTPTPVGERGLDGQIPDQARPTLQFAMSGALTDLDALWTSLEALAPQARDSLAAATHLCAFDTFLQTLPDGPHVWLGRPTHPSEWVDLARSEEDLRRTLGTGRDWRVLGSTGFGPLDPHDVIRHEATLSESNGDDPGWLAVSRHDFWAWHRLASALLRHGSAFAAWVHHDEGSTMWQGPFEEIHVGAVESIESFCFSIGLRDGWWLPAVALAGDHGLGHLLRPDVEAMWSLYERAGWRIVPPVMGEDHCHLFAPWRHIGPPPTVRELIDSGD